ncbi:MAG: 2-C-methyl-D-erythritol 4-phosphate cytidylyltransferase [Arcanobacterium sp.]|nr:2-C-methyl-D-erythritol 4-phosphate cytidylyltransferase [Arcanobacterium sp.]
MSVAALIAGAGSGTRLGANVPKALVELSGKPLILWAAESMLAAGVNEIIVTIPAGETESFANVLHPLKGMHPNLELKFVVGGSTRQMSVANGLAAVEAEYVLIHDAARALTPVKQIETVIQALENGNDAVIPALAVVDTVKRIKGENFVSETLDRTDLRAIQTPQGFRTEVIRAAHKFGESLSETEQSAVPDDAALIELMGAEVLVVPGSRRALKITTAEDLALSEFFLTYEEQD